MKYLQGEQTKVVGIVSNSTWYTYNFRLGLLKRLQEEGCKVVVIAPKDHYSTRLIAEGFYFQHLDLEIYSKNPFSEIKVILQLKELYQKMNFDLVIHYTAKPNVYGSIAAWSLDIPSIAITTGLGALRAEKGHLSKWILRKLYRIVGALASEVWFLNQEDQAYFLSRKMVIPKKAKILNSEGVNVQWYYRQQKLPSTQSDTVRFLFAGRIVKSKGAELFYQAASKLKAKGIRAKFEMVGFIVPEHPDGISFETVQQWQASGAISYLGEAEDIRPYIEQTDCVVLPSYFGEGVPRILLEAASMATPIITTNFVGCKEVVVHQSNGLLCKAKDVDSLEMQMEYFCGLPVNERQQMGLEGRKRIIKKFDEQLVIEEYLKAIKTYLPIRKTIKKATIKGKA